MSTAAKTPYSAGAMSRATARVVTMARTRVTTRSAVVHASARGTADLRTTARSGVSSSSSREPTNTTDRRSERRHPAAHRRRTEALAEQPNASGGHHRQRESRAGDQHRIEDRETVAQLDVPADGGEGAADRDRRDEKDRASRHPEKAEEREDEEKPEREAADDDEAEGVRPWIDPRSPVMDELSNLCERPLLRMGSDEPERGLVPERLLGGRRDAGEARLERQRARFDRGKGSLVAPDVGQRLRAGDALPAQSLPLLHARVGAVEADDLRVAPRVEVQATAGA